MEKEDPVSGPQIPPSGRIVALSERQQMALLKKIEDKRKLQLSLKCQTDPQNKKAFNKLNKRNDRGETALHRATIKGDHKKVVELLGQGADVNAKDYAGWTALHEACNHGYLEIVRTLIEHGADVSVKGLDGDTPLHDAAVNGHEEITIALIQSGANPEAENDKKETPLEVAEDAETRRLLLEGIPIFKEYEKTRKKTLQAAKAGNFADCLTTEADDPPKSSTSPRKRSDSVFSAEEGPSPSSSETPKSTAVQPTAIPPVSAEDSQNNQSAMAKDKKEKKKREEKEREEAEERKLRKQKKKAERERAHREAIEAGKQPIPETIEERDKRWTEEIKMKVTLEAQQKNLQLTPDQFKKVVERRIQKRKERHQNKALLREQQNAALLKAKRMKEQKEKIARQRGLPPPSANGADPPKREKLSSSGSTDLKGPPESGDQTGTPKKKHKGEKTVKKEGGNESGRKPSLKFDSNFLDQVDLIKKSKESLKAHKNKQKEIRDRDQKRYKELQRLKELDNAKRSELKALSDSNVQEKKIGDKRPRLGSTNDFLASSKKPKVDIGRQGQNESGGIQSSSIGSATSTFTPLVPKKIEAQQPTLNFKPNETVTPSSQSLTNQVQSKQHQANTQNSNKDAASLPQETGAKDAISPSKQPPKQPPNGLPSRRVSVIQETPLNQQKEQPKTGPPFKPKFKWLTEKGHNQLQKRIEAQPKTLKVVTFNHLRLAESHNEQYAGNTTRKTVHDEQLNDFDERNCINERIQQNWRKIRPVIPDAPHDIENFKLLTGEYHLETSVQDRAAFPKLAPPPELPEKLQLLFKNQENERWKLRQEQTVVLEKLRLSYEQRVLRCYTEAKRLELGVAEYSATAFLQQMNFDNQYQLPIDEMQKKDNRNRYTPRVLNKLLDDAKHDFKLKQHKIIERQRMDNETCYMLQVTNWQLKAQQFSRDNAPKTINDVPEEYVPKVPVIEEAELPIF
ncbi:Oidioi.mRNA.OKI2018_I69.XSR.g16377.t2.cds [Oikopleura dioica]|uniref:Oidioi.mRNA.OKI2018_I69.XSR.g16377.t2.cds n=1 Tax=Oikopleura dioica TaxID=34765 RepID=A0ABN7SFW4_OIKDI|nr:Oidioi.mRNA.OKI2018_I69.XSR.g16377.t2.cds [Oikopleura dioica]